jgi:hypothetical protein
MTKTARFGNRPKKNGALHTSGIVRFNPNLGQRHKNEAEQQQDKVMAPLTDEIAGETRVAPEVVSLSKLQAEEGSLHTEAVPSFHERLSSWENEGGKTAKAT